jgi:hypothetical protein
MFAFTQYRYVLASFLLRGKVCCNLDSCLYLLLACTNGFTCNVRSGKTKMPRFLKFNYWHFPREKSKNLQNYGVILKWCSLLSHSILTLKGAKKGNRRIINQSEQHPFLATGREVSMREWFRYWWKVPKLKTMQIFIQFYFRETFPLIIFRLW